MDGKGTQRSETREVWEIYRETYVKEGSLLND